MSAAASPVAPTAPASITMSAEDHDVLKKANLEVARLQTTLGVKREAYLADERALVNALDQARAGFSNAVNFIAKKHDIDLAANPSWSLNLAEGTLTHNPKTQQPGPVPGPVG